MIQVHFICSADDAVTRSFNASVPAVTDLVAARRLTPLASGSAAQAAAEGSGRADQVVIELTAGGAVPGATQPGRYLIEGLDPAEAERELLTEPGESGG